jgi:flagellar basal-body rod protein FlgG
MSGAIYQAASGALLQQMRLEVLSNNLANVSTAGYKSDKVVFRLSSDQSDTAATHSPGRLSPYAPPMEAAIDHANGPLTQTGNPMDLAIVGKGFFEVQGPAGPLYTRNGHFTVNQDGLLSTSQGLPVVGQSGEISIGTGHVQINGNGDIYVNGAMSDTLKIVDFDVATHLQKQGDTLFAPSQEDQVQSVDEGYEIAQGYVEGSNVNAVRTMTEMIETLRIFEAYQKVIRAVDDTTAKTVNEVGVSV